VPRKNQYLKDQAQPKLEHNWIMRNDNKNYEQSTEAIKINKIITAVNSVAWIIN